VSAIPYLLEPLFPWQESKQKGPTCSTKPFYKDTNLPAEGGTSMVNSLPNPPFFIPSTALLWEGPIRSNLPVMAEDLTHRAPERSGWLTQRGSGKSVQMKPQGSPGSGQGSLQDPDPLTLAAIHRAWAGQGPTGVQYGSSLISLTLCPPTSQGPDPVRVGVRPGD
jgi:hypothetical protein